MPRTKKIDVSQNLGYTIKQQRSQKTYKALINTGFQLLEKRSFESISIAELAREAGYSVGAFYSRFRSKDEYFDSLVQFHIESRLEANRQLCATVKPNKLIEALIDNMVVYYWEHRQFWRAALIRNTRDPNFWEPIRELGKENVQTFFNFINDKKAKPLTSKQQLNIQFAFQITHGVINNTILNRPGPLFMGQKEFVDNLIRSFHLVSEYKSLFKA